MGKHTFLGSSKSWDEIPQATSIVLGRNLSKNLKDTSTKHTPGKGHDGAPQPDDQLKKAKSRLRKAGKR
jgi:hypothetical protein